MELHTLPAWELSALIRRGDLGLTDVVSYFGNRIRSLDTTFNAVVNLFDSPLLPDAQTDSPLWGVPVLIKDNINIHGYPMTCASNILKGYVAAYDAHVIERIKNAGMVILGTVNMDEFAFGSSCETSCYGPTRNPWDPACVPGGSSGGSAAAVGAGYVPLTLGSDTGGSIRQPAAFCGAVGVKPTYGLVSRYGLAAFGSSLDQIGPISRDVRDAALMLQTIAGRDRRDSTSVDRSIPDYAAALTGDINGLRIGLPLEYFVEGLDPEVRDAIEKLKMVLAARGAVFVDVSLPHTQYAVATYYIVASSEASTNLSRFDGMRYGARKEQTELIDTYRVTRQQGFGKEAKRRIMLGSFSLSSGYYDAYYGKAQKVRTMIKRDFQKVFEACDVLLSPTAPTPPFKIGEKCNDPIGMYLSDVYTIPASLAGVPAFSMPCGFTDNGLPVGAQLIGNYFAEETLFNVIYAYQQETDWHKRFPVLL